MKNIRKNIKKKLEDCGYKQKDVAREWGITEAAVSVRFRRPSIDTVIDVAELLGCTTDELIFGKRKRLKDKIPTHITLTFGGVPFRYEVTHIPDDDE